MNYKNVLSIDLDYAKSPEQQLKLIDIFCNILQTRSEIYFVQTHHSVLDFLSEPIHLYNIDDHHDMGYGPDPLNYLLDKKCGVREGNWILHCILTGIVKKYTWIGNIDSKFIYEHISRPIRDLEYFKKTFDLSAINYVDFDKVFICESQDYLASGAFLFEALKVLHKNFKGDIKTCNIPNEHRELDFKYEI